MTWIVLFFQIEKERDEHLMPRFNASPEHESEPEEHIPPTYVPAGATSTASVLPPSLGPRSPESSGSPDSDPERLQLTSDSRMQPTLRPVEPPPPASMSTVSSPDVSEDDSMPMQGSMQYSDTEDSTSQHFIGPSTRDDHSKSKLGFGSLKLGKGGAKRGKTPLLSHGFGIIHGYDLYIQ